MMKQLLTITGLPHKGARGREGGYPTSAAAIDLRWKTDVRQLQSFLYHIPPPVSTIRTDRTYQ